MSGSKPPVAGAGPVRERHRFDAAALTDWLTGHLPGFDGPLELLQFSGGQSNPTFLLHAASGDYVLRKQPPGKLLPSAHAIDREYRVMGALAGSGVPVPRMRLYCEDASVIGTPFYVMDFVPGRIFDDPLLPGLSPDERSAVYLEMGERLAALHAFDWRAAGLEDFGRHAGYVERQLARWGKPFAPGGGADSPLMSRLLEWLAGRLPAADEVSLTHGDYRLGNLIYAPGAPRVLAVLDWELATLGHPLADLAFNCMTYHLPAGHPVAPGFVGVDLAALGIPDEASYLAAYARALGLDAIPDWRFFMVFSLFRTAAIQHGVWQRARQGNAASATAALFGESYRMVADAGWQLAQRDEGA
jgi:aminoglycoside phosphotransferase (APT) family kinase protein